MFIIREARATLAHLQYLLVAAFFLCRQPPCSLLSPTHHRINFALSNCDHLLYLSPLDWPNPSSSNAESISRHVASPNWESCSTTVPARTCDQPTRPSSPSSFVWPCDRNLSACLPPTDRPRWPPVPPRSAYVFPPEPSPILRTVTDLTLQLTREYKSITENPPPYITAHPSDSNILEWHYIITGPENTPYHGGQYWGTLIFPNNYPFAPPAIRMHTPSGRFQPSSRLCLSISDFHPRSFNPAWEVSTILIGLLSFMTSDEMTTGSVSATEAERRAYAARSRWWNSTGGGSHKGPATNAGKGNVRAGDGGAKFKAEWPEVDQENWKWMKEHKVDVVTGSKPDVGAASCGPQLGIAAAGSGHQAHAVVDAVIQQRDAGQGWVFRNKLFIFGSLVFFYVLVARLLGEGS